MKIQTGEFLLLRLDILHKYVIYNLLWLWLEIKLICLINLFYFKYRRTSDQPLKTTSALLFHGSTELELNHNLARMIQSDSYFFSVNGSVAITHVLAEKNYLIINIL